MGKYDNRRTRGESKARGQLLAPPHFQSYQNTCCFLGTTSKYDYISINQKKNIIIGDFNPSRVFRNQPLWIHGEGFCSTQCRVTIGQHNAIIYSCSYSLIKCIVPDLGNEDTDVLIQV